MMKRERTKKKMRWRDQTETSGWALLKKTNKNKQKKRGANGEGSPGQTGDMKKEGGRVTQGGVKRMSGDLTQNGTAKRLHTNKKRGGKAK